MSLLLSLRKSLAGVLMFSLVVTGFLTLNTRQSYASHNSLPHSLAPTVNDSSEETVPQAETVDETTRARFSEAYGKLPLSFEENRGQVDAQVKYISRGSGYTLFLTPSETVLTLRNADEFGRNENDESRHARQPQSAIRNPQSAVLRMKLKGANRSPTISGEGEMGVRTNYFIGNDPQQWQADVARYERVRYEKVYPGIDMIYYGRQQQLEYDFEVAPGADSSQIALKFEGVKRVKVERKTGELVLETAGGEVRQRKPVAYQEVGVDRREVASRYVMQGQRKVGIEVGEYDRTKRLVIDPVLSYSTYLGGSNYDSGYGIAVDSSGNVYVTGETSSTNFPKVNQYQASQGNSNAFVTKLNTNASGAASLLYSTYLGGNSFATGYGIAVDSSGIVYVTGSTGSTNFPTLNQYQAYQASSDAFVTKLDTNASGAASLLYSTYLGGDNIDVGQGIAIDSSSHAYVTGVTYSTNFPTLNQYQTDQGGPDAFVTKFDTNASGAASLLYSTYLGGNNRDIGNGIAVDSSDSVYVTGMTYSTNFPTLNQYQFKQGDDQHQDAFVTKLNMSASGADSLSYSTYLGGDSFDAGTGIAVGSYGYAYVTGWTESSNFPTIDQYQTHQGSRDVFVTKLYTYASGADSFYYSTYLGGDGVDTGRGIAVDSAGNAYVTGETYSTNFPTFNQYQTYQGGVNHSDAFVAKVDTTFYGYYGSGAASLRYSTYLGGSDSDTGRGIAVDSAGNAYVTGETSSNNFPRLNQYQANQPVTDAFVTKLTDTYTISGQVRCYCYSDFRGVIVTLSGPSSGTVVTDYNGYYSFAGLMRGGDYKISVAKSGVVFDGSYAEFRNLRNDWKDINFYTKTVMIYGRVTKDTATGAGLSGVTIKMTVGVNNYQVGSATTWRDGSYAFIDVATPGDYTLTPSKGNYYFSPAQRVLSNLTHDQYGRSFVATTKTNIGGVVKLGAAGLSGVTVTLTSPTPAGFTAQSITTSSAGAYSFLDVPAGRNYRVTAMKDGYQFTPAHQSITNLSVSQTAVNFAVRLYNITGRITRTGTTTGIGSVTVTLTSSTPDGFPARTVRTDSTGDYTFANLPAGRSYAIKPVKTGLTFSPATRSITNLSRSIGAGASTNFGGTGP